MKIVNYCNKIIEFSFYALFLLVPLAFTSSTSELFEFNKMWLTFGLAAIIGGAWAAKTILSRELRLQRTPLDIPIAFFLASQIISTVFSLDSHVSLWGYYSRFNGGLLSIITYIFLYYAFVTNLPSLVMVKRALVLGAISGFLVALWGLPSHFGYDPTCYLFRGTLDVACWTEDFQPKVRIFSTLGQPDWLAAYLAILIPIVTVFFLRPSFLLSALNEKISKIIPSEKNLLASCFLLLAFSLFFLDLLYTKSRGGMLSIIAAIFLISTLISFVNTKRTFEKISLFSSVIIAYASLVLLEWKDTPILSVIFEISILIFLFLTINPALQKRSSAQDLARRLTFLLVVTIIISFLVGSPLKGLENFSLEKTKNYITNITAPQIKDSEETKRGQPGGTHAGDIRLIVWRGALDIWRSNPLFGSGVETFAYAYYKYRPVEHNLTSEWDFLYNKAHNEYLNFLATTGSVGLASYILMILSFLLISIKSIKTEFQKRAKQDQWIIAVGIISGYISILISNFFGFSVVVVNIYFFLLPGLAFILLGKIDVKRALTLRFSKEKIQLSELSLTKTPTLQWAFLLIILLFTFYLLITLYRFWNADQDYNLGYSHNRAGDYQNGYLSLLSAIEKRADEPVFKDELAQTAAVLSVALSAQKESTAAAQLRNQAIDLSDEVIREHPYNVVFLKNRVRIFYALSQSDQKYLSNALDAITKAKTLAPTDAKVSYNLAILYGQNGYVKQATEILQETILLKPDYYDAYYALGLFYRELAVDDKGKIVDEKLQQKATETMYYILDNFASDDANVLKALESWEKI